MIKYKYILENVTPRGCGSKLQLILFTAESNNEQQCHSGHVQHAQYNS